MEKIILNFYLQMNILIFDKNFNFKYISNDYQITSYNYILN